MSKGSNAQNIYTRSCSTIEQPLTQQLDMPQLLSYSTEKRETLPSHEVHSSNQKVQKEVQENDRRAKDKLKEYADKKRKARNSNLNTGDTILVRQRKQNKLSTHFDPKPWEVVMKKGTMVTACRDDKYITWNISQYPNSRW